MTCNWLVHFIPGEVPIPNPRSIHQSRQKFLSRIAIGNILMAMTWETLTGLLTREFRNLRRMPVVNFGFATQPVTDVQELRSEELLLAERVDTLVRDFARTRRWPALDEKERYFLRERIRFAYEYCSIAETTVRQPISMATRPRVWNQQRRLVEWLLIDVWRNSGVHNWLEPFTLMHGAARSEAVWELHISE